MTYSTESTYRTDLSHNQISVQVFQLLEDLESSGQSSNPRGLQVREANLATLDIDPLYSIIDFEPRRFSYRYFAGELAWYIKKNNDIKYISNFSTFWNKIAVDNRVNSNYGNLLFNNHPDKLDNQEGNQLEWVYNSLVKDKNSRQAVAFFNSPYFQTEGNKDFVCTMYANFWIRHDTLDMKIQMRSNDVYFGLSYDAPWFASLHQSMYLNLKKIYPKLKLGIYYHCADNIHYYERHFELTDKILDSTLLPPVKLELKTPLFTFDENSKIKLTKKALTFSKSMDKDLKKISKKEIIDDNYFKDKLSILYKIS